MRDLFIEIALWDKFGWGPRETEKLTLEQLRFIFALLESKRM